MKKILLLLAIITIIAITLCGCIEGDYQEPNVEVNGVTSNTITGKDSLTKIGNGLYYDSTTNIVYWWNGTFEGRDYVTMPTPYYASNGLPYKYDPRTNTLKEINSHAK